MPDGVRKIGDKPQRMEAGDGVDTSVASFVFVHDTESSTASTVEGKAAKTLVRLLLLSAPGTLFTSSNSL